MTKQAQQKHDDIPNPCAETARKLGVSQATVRWFWHLGTLGSVKLGKRRMSLDSQIAAFIAGGRRDPADQPRALLRSIGGGA